MVLGRTCESWEKRQTLRGGAVQNRKTAPIPVTETSVFVNLISGGTHALAGAGFILWTFMHDCNGTTTRMKQRPDFCMSDAISILELLQEMGEEGMGRGGIF